MTTIDALDIVLDLAIGNVLEDDQIDGDDELEEEQKRQVKAVKMVTKLLKNKEFINDYR